MRDDKIKILLVDDDEDDYVIISDTLSQIKNQEFNFSGRPDSGNPGI